jgi:hypothetical protein
LDAPNEQLAQRAGKGSINATAVTRIAARRIA